MKESGDFVATTLENLSGKSPMSVWIPYRDRDGRRKWMSVTISFQAILLAVVVAVTMLLPVVQYLRDLFR